MASASPDELALGVTLPWPVYDRHGKLLLGRGVLISCQAQLDALLERGVYASVRASDAADTLVQSADLPVFEAAQALQRDMQRAHWQLLNRVPDTLPRVAALADAVVSLMRRDPDAMLAALQLEIDVDNHAARQLHAAALCVLGARVLGLDDAAARSLLLAGLTYDVALGPLASVLNRQNGGMTEAQWLEVKAHPRTAHELLVDSGVADPLWLDSVLHHHERLDGSGYPVGVTGEAIAPLTRILAIVDIYTAMVRPRAYRGAVHAKAALRSIFLERGRAVDEAMAQAFIKEIGVFPPGTLVRLANGEVGVVRRRGENAAHPTVARLVMPGGALASVGLQRNTSEPEFAIVETVSQEPHGALLTRAVRLWC